MARGVGVASLNRWGGERRGGVRDTVTWQILSVFRTTSEVQVHFTLIDS